MFRFLNMALVLALTSGFNAPIHRPASKFSKMVMMSEAEAREKFLAPAAEWKAQNSQGEMSMSAPSSEAQLPVNVQGEEMPYIENWGSPRDEFCFGTGGAPHSISPAINGATGMTVTNLLNAPAGVPAIAPSVASDAPDPMFTK